MGEVAVAGSGNRAIAAVLFMAAGTMSMDVYSTLNSSPWTAESFGGDPDKAKACREYVYHAIGWSTFYGVMSAVIAQSIWPIISIIITNVYLYWLYNRALNRAQNRQSKGWS